MTAANEPKPGPRPDPRLTLIDQIGHVKVYMVDGRVVRDKWFLDFTEGSNDAEAPDWMPANEIWVDDYNAAEKEFILLHEMHERNIMMEEGLDYDSAHDRANDVEDEARQSPERLNALLEREKHRLIRIQPGFTAAGVLLQSQETGRILYLRRGPNTGDHRGTWAFAGGRIEPGETAARAARRECIEEIGYDPGHLVNFFTDDRYPWFATFPATCGPEFNPRLCSEHTEFVWSETPPQPLHPGVSAVLGLDEFKEGEHPRDDDGQFSTTGGGGSSTRKSEAHLSGTSKVTNGKRTQANGEALPEHIRKLAIPPAWTDVKWSPDPHAKVLAAGTDSKGRRQKKYNEQHVKKAAKAKFSRVEAVAKAMPKIIAKNEANQKSKDPTIRAMADCTDLIMKMGIRPGSERDTGADKKAYGASTLEGRHVKQENGKVILDFDSKKGGHTTLTVTDPSLMKMLVARAKAAGPSGQIFEGIATESGGALRRYVKSIAGSKFTVKDFRTGLGTATAQSIVKELPAPTSLKEYKKKVMEVAQQVSQRLGNTPSMALKAYINPGVFEQWKGSVGVPLAA